MPPPEFKEFESLYADFRTLSDRQSLVHILDKSFRELNEFVESLEKSDNGHSPHTVMLLNKHFMDYLSAGYALREHLETSLKRDFGRTSEHAVRFPQVLWYLEKTCFEYAFLQDLRNFAQHCAFPVGNLQLTRSHSGGALSVSYSRQELVQAYKGWKKSGLESRPESEIDLLAAVRTAHRAAIQKFSGVVCLAYGKNLAGMDHRFSQYHKEAADINPNSVARIVLSVTGNPANGEVKLQDVPRDVYRLLGLKRPSSGSAF